MTALLRNNVVTNGNGKPAIIFAHGFGCDQNMWRLVAPAFEDTHKVVLFDHVGAGRSDLTAYRRNKYSSLDGYASDIIEIIEELELTDVIFVGHSVSSMIGVIAANKRPDLFSRLVLVGPSPSYIDDNNYVGGFSRAQIDELLDTLENNHLGWSAAMAPVIMGNPERKELADELAKSFCRTDPEIAKEFARVTFLSDTRYILSNVSIPSLILQCANDVIAPRVVGEYVHSKIPASKLAFMKATGHCPNLSAPEETIALIKDYLNY